ncbi:dihydrofolate reductase family protein [Aestuariibius sp. 2305UL40-4]|uniref:dihydrofolate reductase family protein n=1 Tax=Aestuariibius violaceus TaxID=3234132 RepID=UPI00345EEEB4
MRRLAVLSFVTLDGVMQSPSAPEEDTSGGFSEGGWAAPYWDEVMPHVERIAMSRPYDILFGRKTYDLFAGHWPNAPKSDLGDRLNAARKYVVTSRSEPLTWENTHALTGPAASAVRELKAAATGPWQRRAGPDLAAEDLSAIFQISKPVGRNGMACIR